jgi:ribosomal protein L12E/L44/L45/RPP1/RPP2
LDITAENLVALVDAAGVEGVEGIFPKLFANALGGKDVSSFFLNIGGGAVGGVSAPVAVSGGEPAAEAKEEKKGKKEEKKEEEEEGDDDMFVSFLHSG